jgi:hypothetical protein
LVGHYRFLKEAVDGFNRREWQIAWRKEIYSGHLATLARNAISQDFSSLGINLRFLTGVISRSLLFCFEFNLFRGGLSTYML